MMIAKVMSELLYNQQFLNMAIDILIQPEFTRMKLKLEKLFKNV